MSLQRILFEINSGLSMCLEGVVAEVHRSLKSNQVSIYTKMIERTAMNARLYPRECYKKRTFLSRSVIKNTINADGLTLFTSGFLIK